MNISKLNISKQSRAIILIGSVVVAGLNACGVPTDTSGSPPDAVTFLNDFFVVDDAGTPPDGNIVQIVLPVPVVPTNAIVDASFTMSWDVESSDPFFVRVHISADSNNNFDTGDEIFFESQCGSDNTVFDCDFIDEQVCGIVYEPEFDSNMVFIADHYYLRCPSGVATITELEITNRSELVGFPDPDLIPPKSITTYFVFRVCNATGSSCLSANSVEIKILDAPPP